MKAPCAQVIIIAALFSTAAWAVADDLGIAASDLRIEQRDDGGYHLFVRAKSGLGSILLVESTKDPGGVADNYAYRAELWNPVNGDEKRLLNGAFIDPKAGLWSLIDSTPERMAFPNDGR